MYDQILKKVRATEGRNNFPMPILAKTESLSPNQVHDDGGYIGGGISNRGSNTNLLDSYIHGEHYAACFCRAHFL